MSGFSQTPSAHQTLSYITLSGLSNMCFWHGISPAGEARQPHHERGSEEDQGASSWHITGMNLRTKSSSVRNSNLAFKLALDALGLGFGGHGPLVPSFATYSYRNCPPLQAGSFAGGFWLFLVCVFWLTSGNRTKFFRAILSKSDQRDPPVIRGVTCPRTQWGKSSCLSRLPPSTRTGAGIAFEGRTHCPKTN